jgi:hypothetical protein
MERLGAEGGKLHRSLPGLVPIALCKPRRPRCGLADAPDTGFLLKAPPAEFFSFAGVQELL